MNSNVSLRNPRLFRCARKWRFPSKEQPSYLFALCLLPLLLLNPPPFLDDRPFLRHVELEMDIMAVFPCEIRTILCSSVKSTAPGCEEFGVSELLSIGIRGLLI